MVAGRIDTAARRRRESTVEHCKQHEIAFGMIFSEVGPAGCERVACVGKTARITPGGAAGDLAVDC